MKVRVKFEKTEGMRFVGHLDLMRFFQKSIRRANIPIKYSEGFSPHQIMSFAAPLGLGIEGLGEYMDIELYDEACAGLKSDEAVKILNENMCEGMEVLSFRQLKGPKKNAMSSVGLADYILLFNLSGINDEDNIQSNFSENDFRKYPELLMSNESLLIEKKSKDKVKVLDIMPFIRHIEYTRNTVVNKKSFYGDMIFMNITQGSTDNLKPELVLQALKKYGSMPDINCSIIRTELYDEGHRSLEDYGEDIT